jgi:hypothetical protein
MSWSKIQTTFCTNGENRYTELSICPLLKRSPYNQIITDSGDMYFQLYDKIVCLTADGITKIWYNKPTLKMAFADKGAGSYYEFREDDSVFHSYLNSFGDKISIEWSPPAYTSITEGTALKGYFDTESYTYEDTIPCNICGSDCVGGDYEKWGFCSRSCMVESTRD